MTNEDDSDDLRAFRDAVQGARPLKSDRARADSERPRPRARFTRRDARDVLDESLHGDPDPSLLGTGDELFFARPGLPRQVLRKLKRGGYRIASELDLHGLNVSEASAALSEFLHECERYRHTCVRIVTGKGKRSGHTGPVLKPKVARWLAKRDDVQAYSTARPVDGGHGALYVLLAHR